MANPYARSRTRFHETCVVDGRAEFTRRFNAAPFNAGQGPLFSAAFDRETVHARHGDMDCFVVRHVAFDTFAHDAWAREFAEPLRWNGRTSFEVYVPHTRYYARFPFGMSTDARCFGEVLAYTALGVALVCAAAGAAAAQ